MDWRTAWIVIGIVGVCCLALVLSVLYPFTTTSSMAADPPSERFTVYEADAYSSSGQILVDGEVAFAYTGTVTSSGTWYTQVEEQTLTTESYRPQPDSRVYKRYHLADTTAAERFYDELQADDDRELLDSEWGDDQATFIVATNSSPSRDPISGSAGVVVNNLHVLGYETTSRPAGGEDTVYTPRAGWYGNTNPYRVTNVAGTVHTSPDGQRVTAANVSWTVTEPAGTYAESVVVRLTSDDPTAYQITLTVDSAAGDLSQPAWVDPYESAE